MNIADMKGWDLHLAASADFSQLQISGRSVQGHVDPGPHSKLEPLQAKKAEKKQQMKGDLVKTSMDDTFPF